MPRLYDLNDVARAKRLLADAPRTRLANGVVPRIAKATGLSIRVVHAIAQGDRHGSVEPAPTAATDGLVDWTDIVPDWAPLSPQGTPLTSPVSPSAPASSSPAVGTGTHIREGADANA